MSLLRNLERRSIDPENWGLDPSVIPSNGQLDPYSPVLVSGRGALRHWALYASAKKVADAILTLPVDLLQGSGSAATPADQIPTVLRKPSAESSRPDWMASAAFGLVTTGNIYGLVATRDYYEYPTQINLVTPGQITAQWDPNGKKIYKGRNGKTLSNEQVWHLTGLVWPGDCVGIDPITHFVRTITLGLEAERYGSDYFQHGAHPTAVASTDQPVDKDQAETIKDRIRQAVARRDIAVLGAGLKLEPWQGSPNEAKLDETIQLNAVQICAILGVPPEKIGISIGGGSVTYANREQRAQDFLDDAVNPWLVRLETALSDWFPRNQQVKFNTGGFLKSDLSTRFGAYKTATGGRAWMEPSEARALENWPAIPGIDDRPAPTQPTTPPEAPNGNSSQG